MAKLEVVFAFASGSTNCPTIIDRGGRLWQYEKGQWHLVCEIPDQPAGGPSQGINEGVNRTTDDTGRPD